MLFWVQLGNDAAAALVGGYLQAAVCSWDLLLGCGHGCLALCLCSGLGSLQHMRLILSKLDDTLKSMLECACRRNLGHREAVLQESSYNSKHTLRQEGRPWLSYSMTDTHQQTYA